MKWSHGKLTALVAAGLAIALMPAPAIANVPNCLNRCHGYVRYNSNNNLHAVGIDLSVKCLHVPNRASTFANVEMWLFTQTLRPVTQRNWVEAGMTSGTLWASPGQEQGFIWFWADMYGDRGDYYEHYVGPASVNSLRNVSFYWESPGWGVHIGGANVGWSGVGPFPGPVDVGGESVDGLVNIDGRAVNWQYADQKWNWRRLSGGTIGRTGEAIYAILPNATTIDIYTPFWHCGAPAPTAVSGARVAPPQGAVDGRALMRSPEGVRTVLASQADRMVARWGSGDLAGARYVSTSRAVAVGKESRVADDRPVYLIQVKGSFGKQFGDRGKVSGGVLEIVVDAETGQLTDWGISAGGRDIGTIGETRSL